MQHDLAVYLLLLELPLQRLLVLLVLALVFLDVLDEFLYDQIIGRLRCTVIRPREVIKLDNFSELYIFSLVDDY